MCSELERLINDPRLYAHLLRIDQDLARRYREAGCVACGGRLDSATYPRKPRGGPPELEAAYWRRLSWCCDRCRQRLTPPSVRFLGRRVYHGAILVLACSRRLTPEWLAKLTELLGVNRRTVRRWQRWWVESFPHTPLWQVARGSLLPPVQESALPRALIQRFAGGMRERLVAMLQFISPLSTRSTMVDADPQRMHMGPLRQAP